MEVLEAVVEKDISLEKQQNIINGSVQTEMLRYASCMLDIECES